MDCNYAACQREYSKKNIIIKEKQKKGCELTKDEKEWFDMEAGTYE